MIVRYNSLSERHHHIIIMLCHVLEIMISMRSELSDSTVISIPDRSPPLLLELGTVSVVNSIMETPPSCHGLAIDYTLRITVNDEFVIYVYIVD